MSNHDPLPVVIACAGILAVLGSFSWWAKRRGQRAASVAASVSRSVVDVAPAPQVASPETRSEVTQPVMEPPSAVAPNAPLFAYALSFAPDAAEIRANRVWSFLEKYSFDWLTPREELEAQTAPLLLPPWNDKVVPLRHEHPAFREMIVPICAGTGTEPGALPPAFYGVVSKETDDPKVNFERVVARLGADLGAHGADVSSNVYSAVWSAGPAEIKVLVWPKHLNPHQYRADSWCGDPATREAVHVYFSSGLVFHLHEAEESDLLAARPLSLSRGELVSEPRQSHLPLGGGLAFLRALPAKRRSKFRSLQGKLLFNETRRCLFMTGEAHAWVLPLQNSPGLRLVRVTPAKGSGYSSLYLGFPPAEKNRRRELAIAAGDGPDDLTELAESLAAEVGVPLQIEPYEPDM